MPPMLPSSAPALLASVVLSVSGIAVAADPPTPVAVELFGPGLFSTGHDDAHITFSADGDTAYFLRNSPDFAHWTMLVSHRRDGRWQPPAVVDFSGRYSDADLSFDPGGRRALFISNRPTAGGGARPDTEIWSLQPDGEGWAQPRHVAALGSDGNEWYPNLTRDGWLYFGSERAGGHGQSDLWRARWDGGRFGPPENLGPVINTPGQEIEVYPDPDGRYLIFAAKDRKPGAGAYDLYVSWHCADGWSPPRQLPAGVNSAGWEFGPRIDPEGRYLYFTSNRSDFRRDGERFEIDVLEQRLGSPGNGLRDIYRVKVADLGLASPCRD